MGKILSALCQCLLLYSVCKHGYTKYNFLSPPIKKNIIGTTSKLCMHRACLEPSIPMHPHIIHRASATYAIMYFAHKSGKTVCNEMKAPLGGVNRSTENIFCSQHYSCELTSKIKLQVPDTSVSESDCFQSQVMSVNIVNIFSGLLKFSQMLDFN